MSSVTSYKFCIVTLDDDSNDPIIPYGFGVPLSLNDPSIPPNYLAAMRVFQQNPTQHDNNYSPQSPEPSAPSPISTTPLNLSTIERWENPQAIVDDNTFYSDDEPKQVHWTSPMNETFHLEGDPRQIYLLPSPSPPSPPRKMGRKLEMGMSLPKRRGVSQRACGTSEQIILSTKDTPRPSPKD